MRPSAYLAITFYSSPECGSLPSNPWSSGSNIGTVVFSSIFGTLKKKKSCDFEVLNKTNLQFQFHGWVVHRKMNLMSLTKAYLADDYCSITVSILCLITV